MARFEYSTGVTKAFHLPDYTVLESNSSRAVTKSATKEASTIFEHYFIVTDCNRMAVQPFAAFAVSY